MKRTILGILTAAAFAGSVGAATAQTVWYDNGMYSGGSTYGYTMRNGDPQVPYADRQGFFYGM
jgi:hypothetical protein